jgi:hypothetical protein
MLSTTPPIATTSQLIFPRRFGVLSPIFDAVSLVVLPSLVALLISATLVGHGHMSTASTLEVFDAMAQVSTLPSIDS